MAKQLGQIINKKSDNGPREVPGFMSDMAEKAESKSLNQLRGQALVNSNDENDDGFIHRAFDDWENDEIPELS